MNVYDEIEKLLRECPDLAAGYDFRVDAWSLEVISRSGTVIARLTEDLSYWEPHEFKAEGTEAVERFLWHFDELEFKLSDL